MLGPQPLADYSSSMFGFQPFGQPSILARYLAHSPGDDSPLTSVITLRLVGDSSLMSGVEPFGELICDSFTMLFLTQTIALRVLTLLP